MLFFLQKVISSFIEPPGILILLGIVFCFFSWRRKENVSVIIAMTVILYIFSTGAGLQLFPIPSYPVPSAPSAPPQLIIVLGGGTITDRYQNQSTIGPYSLLRLYQGFLLWQKEKLPVLVSGGHVWGRESKTEAELMAKILLSWGVPPEDIIQEDQSRTTWENAERCADILKEKNWRSFYLVTSETHLKRSILSFRFFLPDTVIIPVSAHPPYDRAPLSFVDFLPSLQAFYAIAQIIHEYAGLLSYCLLK